MDETSPVFENFLNNMSRLSGGTRKVAASKFLQREDTPTVEGNARKIRIIARILKARRVNMGQNIMDIKETMMSILGTLEAQEKFEYEKFLDMQRRMENDKRKRRESGLELDKKGLNFINRGVNKVLKPVKSIFSRVISGIFNLIAGRLLIKLLNFFANPRNAAIVRFLSGFIETFFPVLLGGIAVAAIGLKTISGALTLAVNILKGLSVGLGVTPAASGVTAGLRDRGATGRPFLISNVFKGSTFKNIVKRLRFNTGGIVPGSGNTDSVPAMLTPGEVVISKPAVQSIGAGRLLSLNRQFGGTGRPSFRGGMPYAKEGMEVKKTPKLEDFNAPTIEMTMNTVLENTPDIKSSDLNKNVGSVKGFNKLAMSNTNQNILLDFIKNIFTPNFKPEKKEVVNNENLKPNNKNNLQVSDGLTDINDITNKLKNPDESLEIENDVINISLNPADLNKIETLGMVA